MGRKRDFWMSERRKNLNYIMYYNKLLELSISEFKWEGLPDTIDKRYLELCLCCMGAVVVFRDEVMGWLALPMTMNGPLDVYGNPINRRAYSTHNGYNIDLTPENSVIIYDNMLKTPSMITIENFALKLYECDQSAFVNTKAQKTPILIRCNENQRLTLKNAVQQYDGNEYLIFSDNNSDLRDSFSVLKTDAPYVADKLQEQKTIIWNEFLTFRGIANVNITKKERLITDEVTRNMGGTVASEYSFLDMRQNAADEINRKFGFNCKVDMKEELKVKIEIETFNTNENVEEGEEE